MTPIEERRTRAQWTGEHRCHARRRLLMARGFRENEDERVDNGVLGFRRPCGSNPPMKPVLRQVLG